MTTFKPYKPNGIVIMVVRISVEAMNRLLALGYTVLIK